MKARLYYFSILLLLLLACEEQKEISSVDPVNWEKRAANISTGDSLLTGKTYLSIYSQIYSQSEHKTHNLTAMVSLRNTSESDTIYINKAAYFGTSGQLLRTYFDKPIYLAPYETVEIIIDELDNEGGTGANFIFDWKTLPDTSEPLFEGVMNSTMGQQGLSFLTQGKRIR